MGYEKTELIASDINVKSHFVDVWLLIRDQESLANLTAH
jgi:hypothetical protein